MTDEQVRYELGLYLIETFHPPVRKEEDLAHLEQMKKAHLSLLSSEFSSMRGNWVFVYKGLVKSGKVKPIEQLEQSEKMELWNHAKEMGPKLNSDQLVSLCKSLYSIEYYLNEKP